MVPNNTIVYQEVWKETLQARLDAPQNWKEMCKVEFTNDRVIHNPYLTDPTVQSGTRGCAYDAQYVTETDESTTISTYYQLNGIIDRADLAQSNFTNLMDLADRYGVLLNEQIETAMLASHGSWTDFDNASIGGSAGNITVDQTTIDDIILGVKREIREANGQVLMAQNGVGFVWRAQDFEKLESLAMANGYNTADKYLTEGGVPGLYYMGCYHYVSNNHTANHVFAGVRKVFHLGIVKDTYGQTVFVQNPQGYSGIGINMRVDYAFKAWNKTTGVLFDVAVA